MRGRLSLLTLLVSLVGLFPSTGWTGDSSRFDALVGLARSERAAGRPAQALDLFRQADHLKRFDAILLAEVFWTATGADSRAANEMGRRLLAGQPTQANVRDKLIELAQQSHDERRVMELAEEGGRINPRAALWHRRVGESRLRQRQPAQAAVAFARAAAAPDGTRADAAQSALSLEAAGSMQAAYEAWRRIDEGVWRSHTEWVASRMRTIAAIEPPLTAAKTVTEYLARVPADEQARALLVALYAKGHRPALALEALAPLLAGRSRTRWLRRESDLAGESGDVDRAIRAIEELSQAGLSSASDDLKQAQWLASKDEGERLDAALRSLKSKSGDCSTAPLEVLDTLKDPTRLIQAVQARQSQCADQPVWLNRAVARAVAAGLHAPALAMLERLLAAGGTSVEQRELHGLLLLWTGQPKRAILALESVLSTAPERRQAAEALVDALRAEERPDEAWIWVERLLAQGLPDSGKRLVWAQVGLEAHRAGDALKLVDIEPSTPADDRLVRSIRGKALSQLGRFEEARAILEPIVAESPRPEDVIALIDSVEATSGILEAIRVGERWDSADRGWMEVAGRLALLDARNGSFDAARQRLEGIARLDATRGLLLEAEIELASRNPRRALDILDTLLLEQPREMRAVDLYATALAESGDLDQALQLIAKLRAKRPDDVAWQVREADWRLRRSPGQEHLEAVERLAADHPQRSDARLALAAAYARDDRWDAARAALKLDGRSAAVLTEPELDIAVASLTALRRVDDALALVAGRKIGSYSLALRRAELVAQRDGASSAEQLFSEVAVRSDADAAVYLAWAHASGSGAKAERILSDGASRFPDNARLHEQLAVERWATGNVGGARDEASRALTLDTSLVRASIVSIESVRQTDTDAAVLQELDRFEARFSRDPAAMLEVADRLAGYPHSAEDPIARRMIDWADRVIADGPLAARAVLTKARLFAAIGSWKDALDSIATVLHGSPTDRAALKLRAELLSYAGDYASSVAAYDAYLAVAPDDVRARRQQARVEGWRQAYGAAGRRYREMVQLFPEDRVIRAEAEAKTAYYGEHWRRAIAAYRDWLSLEPGDSEGRFELAQAYEQAGELAQARSAYMALAAEVPPHRQSLEAYARLRERRAMRTSFSAETRSASGYGAQRLLDQTDSLAQLSGSRGAANWSVAAGPSRVGDSTRVNTGSRVNARIEAVAGPSWRLEAGFAAHHYSNMDSLFAGGDVSVSWLATDRLRLQGGVERSALLDNLHTVEQKIASAGPRASLSYRATSDLSFDLSASERWLTDQNRRVDARFAAAQQLLRGRNEIRLLAGVEDLQYRESRNEYFSPAHFWKENLGLAYRGWFHSPKYAGDRERWIEATYLAAIDNNQVIYHSGSVGIAHDFASGFSLVGSGTVTRSTVYTSSGLMLTVRLRPFSSNAK
jgi:predicted Zn-dependent protease